jgi:hypothetical protein
MVYITTGCKQNIFLLNDDFLLTLAYIIAENTVFLFACIHHKSKT